MEHNAYKHLAYSCFFVQNGQKVYRICNRFVNIISVALARVEHLHPLLLKGALGKRPSRQGSIILYFSKVRPRISSWFSKSATPTPSLVTRGEIPIVWK